MLLEVCVDSYESAVAAIAGGASRLELCSSLIDGGLTPTPGLLAQIREYSREITVFCMLRCRPGNFVYMPEEVEIMKRDAKILQKYGADGFVFGALNGNGEVEMKQCREIIMACSPLPVTFHRAFDVCKKPTIEIEVIIDLGFKRVLTSGQQSNAQLGVKLIKLLMEQVGDRICIMPGGGINKQNLGFIVEHTGAKEYHGSFKKVKEGEEKEKSGADVEQERAIYVTDRDYVAEVVHILNVA
ncbi:copper homeostasis protein cutC homolog [Tribolium madens]|uniref:copper homeostasis protein cutC homolog n=1 Tax=Tribolium madens TaxID=41895 RepID=UPI001CF7565F|nr:copper homeostasis protein cutC homolog [Tribolium madens]